MYLVEDRSGGIGLMIASLILLGTWPALLNLVERKGRVPQHTFLDYSITNYLLAIIFAFAFGEAGHLRPNFIEQVHQDNGASVGFALAGGIFLVLGNIGTQYALAYCGLSITEVVSSSITVVGGTTINFFLDGRINRAAILFPGVGCFLIAALVGFFVHGSNTRDIQEKLGYRTKEGRLHGKPLEPPAQVPDPAEALKVHKDVETGAEYTPASPEDMNLAMKGGHLVRSSIKGSSAYLVKVEQSRAIKSGGASMIVGLLLCCFNGGMYILFSPAFNLATNDQWHVLPAGVPHLSVYTAFFYFSSSFFFVSFLLNIIFLYFPVLGAPKSSITAWIKDFKGRHWALLAGTICGLGNGFQFMGGQAAGYAAADSVQALPLVSTIWAVVLFGEYHRSSRRTYILLAIMLSLFIAAVGLLMGSAGTRQS